jgi:hypothetical protein
MGGVWDSAYPDRIAPVLRPNGSMQAWKLKNSFRSGLLIAPGGGRPYLQKDLDDECPPA